MSDTDKPTPESPDAETSEASASPSGTPSNVISIDEARAELLGKRRSRTPPKGTARSSPRSRGRDVPAPVTLPPGEHSAVIVTDTPAARAHIDKRTVHPGEAPTETHEKKVRVKTLLDPRRQKTQVTDRRAATPVPPEGTGTTDRASGSYAPGTGESDAAGMFTSQPPSQPPGPRASSQPPPITGSQRPSLVRPRPMTHEGNSGAPLFLIGVAIAAALGATLVFVLSRQKTEPNGPPPVETTAVTVVVPGPSAVPVPTTTATVTPSAPASSSEPESTVSSTPELPSAVPATPVKTGRSTAPRPTSTTTSAAPTASAKPTSTFVLPFGKEEP